MQTIEDILSDWHNREKALILANQFHKDELLKSQTREAELLIKIEKIITWCEERENTYNIPNGGDQNAIAYGCFSAMKQFIKSIMTN